MLLFTGLSPSAHAASSPQDPSPGWWEEMVGPGKAIDTKRYFVVCVNSLGSCFGSTGPASIDPATGLAYRLDFPDLSVEDIARGGFEVDALAGHRDAVARGRRLAGRHGRCWPSRRSSPASRAASSASPAVRRRIAVRDRAALTAARSDPRAIRIGRTASTPATCARPPACAWRASSARSPIAPPRNGNTASAADRLPTGATKRCAGPRAFRGRVRGAGLSERAGRQVRVGVRSELLPVPVARDGSFRSLGARRHARPRR